MSSSAEAVKLYCPIEYTWKITEEKLREMDEALIDQEEDNDANSDTIENESELVEFRSSTKAVPSVPPIKYFLKLQCHLTDLNRFFSLFLHVPYRGEIAERIHGKFSFFVKSANYSSQSDTVFTDLNDNWGDDICTIDEMLGSDDTERKFIVDGMLTVQMKGILIIEQEEMSAMIPESNALSKGLWERDDWDFEIIVGNEGKVWVHKLVLATRSRFFDAMFKSLMKVSTTNSIDISDFALKTVQSAIEFFYCRDIFQTLTFIDAFELIKFADKYIVNDLQLKLDAYFAYQLSPATVCQLANGSVNAHYSKLRDICMDFLITCLRHSIPIEDIDTLDKEFAVELFQKSFSSASN